MPNYPLKIPKYIVLHHFANNTLDLKSEHQIVEVMRTANPREYHYVVFSDGSWEKWQEEIYVAAHSGADKPEQSACLAHNFNSLGVCCLGNFENAKMSEKQFVGLAALIRHLMKKYAIEAKNIVRHNQVIATACPGRNYPYEKLIKAVSEPVLRLKVGSDSAVVRGAPCILPVKIERIAGQAIGPVRWLAENLGFKVVYDAKTETIDILMKD